MRPSASVGFSELNIWNPTKSRTLAQVQIIGLASCPIMCDTRWRSGGPIEHQKSHRDRGAAVEIGSRATGIAQDIELRLLPNGGNIKDLVLAGNAVCVGTITERDRVITAGCRGSPEPELTEVRNRYIRHRLQVAIRDAICIIF